jgi:succinate-semialdehyde dehydrogenase / glutarate-semialdehyde dehydrogenase
MSISTKLPSKALIGGQWVEGSAGTFEVRSPQSGEVVNEIARCSAEDVDRAVAAARAVFPGWADLPVMNRVELLRRVTGLFLERAELIAQTITAEIGKTITEAHEEVYEYSAPAYHRAAEEALRFRGMSFPSTQERTRNKRLVLSHRPLGVVAAITPYNFPTDISSIAIAHILAAGNTVVWKPSEFAASSCTLVAELFEEAGFPAGVVNVVHGFGDVGAALVEHDDVNGIFFTGSTATGELITQRAGLKRMLLELGGDGPLIVLPDADLDAAVDGAVVGCYYYAGQVCTSAERILVHEAVYDDFLDRLRARVRSLSIGDPADDSTDMGPLCNQKTLDRVVEHVEQARSAGATVEQFGPNEGLFYPATIVTDVTEDMRIAQEETFGPVATIFKVKSADEAIRIGNSTKLGLTASVYTKDLATAWRMGEALEHGTVNINETTNYWDQMAPFGGAKNSGRGRELSQWFLEAFTEPKLMIFDLGYDTPTDRRAEGGW